MTDEEQREMTLREYMDKLPSFHGARLEYESLYLCRHRTQNLIGKLGKVVGSAMNHNGFEVGNALNELEGYLCGNPPVAEPHTGGVDDGRV